MMLKHGTKSFNEVWYVWALYGPMTEEEIEQEVCANFPSFDYGPGQLFANAACYRRTKRKTLIRQRRGYDV